MNDFVEKLPKESKAALAPLVEILSNLQKQASELPPYYLNSSLDTATETSIQMDNLFRNQEFILTLKEMDLKLINWQRKIYNHIQYLENLRNRNAKNQQ